MPSAAAAARTTRLAGSSGTARAVATAAAPARLAEQVPPRDIPCRRQHNGDNHKGVPTHMFLLVDGRDRLPSAVARAMRVFRRGASVRPASEAITRFGLKYRVSHLNIDLSVSHATAARSAPVRSIRRRPECRPAPARHRAPGRSMRPLASRLPVPYRALCPARTAFHARPACRRDDAPEPGIRREHHSTCNKTYASPWSGQHWPSARTVVAARGAGNRCGAGNHARRPICAPPENDCQVPSRQKPPLQARQAPTHDMPRHGHNIIRT